jgi:23S rRNA pseudouridine2605 synthase
MKRPEKSGRKNARSNSSDKKEFKGTSARGGAGSRGPRKDSDGPRTRRSSASSDDFSKPTKGRPTSRPSDLDTKPRRKKDFSDFDGPRTRESKSSWDDFDATDKPKYGAAGSRGNREEDRPYKRSNSERPSSGRPVSKRSYHPKGAGEGDKPFTAKKPYSRDPEGDKPFTAKKPYSRDPEGDKPFRADRKPYSRAPRDTEGDREGAKPFTAKKPYSREESSRGDKPFRADRKPYSRSPKEETGERKPYSRTPRDSDKPFAAKKPYNRAPKEVKKASPYRRSDDKIPFKPSDNEEGPRKRFNPDKGAYRSKKTEKGTFTADGPIRLNRYISMAGICSRREADEMILAGVVSVNGEVITELGTKVQAGDEIRYNGEKVRNEELKYVLLNKPKDYITTMEDPEARKTVMELIASACKERVYPVGRLDRNTTGLLLFTNDGDLAKVLTHPSSMVRKIYHVELNKNLKIGDMKLIAEGIELEDGFMQVDEIAFDGDGSDKKMIGLQIHSGKNRIVRRIFEHLGYEVIKLDRVMFAGLTKKDLPRGRYRLLSETEVGMLKMVSPKKMKASR